MKKILISIVVILILALIIGVINAHAQIPPQNEMTPEEAQEILKKDFLTDEVVNASKSLNREIDFIAENYTEKERRALIKNYEVLQKKSAETQGETYLPYERKIDINNPNDVKMYFKRRINIIY